VRAALLLTLALAFAAPASGASYGTTTITIAGATSTLPITGGEVRAHGAVLTHTRALRVAGRRLTGVRVTLRSGGLALSAALGGRRMTFATARGGPELDRANQTARLTQTALRLTPRGARRLGMRDEPAGSVRVAAALPGAEPEVPARPPGAVDVTAATVTWHVRDSFVRYLAAGEGTAVSRGATAEPPATTPESDTALVYDFHYAFRDGWRDPASGRAYVRFAGRVTFRYSDHGIDFDVNDLELDLDGTRSRAVARFTGRGDTRPGNRRGVLVDLDASAGLGQMPGRIPAQTAGSLFAGYYLAGEPFGWISTELAD
jgi:hypothetical protein